MYAVFQSGSKMHRITDPKLTLDSITQIPVIDEWENDGHDGYRKEDWRDIRKFQNRQANVKFKNRTKGSMR